MIVPGFQGVQLQPNTPEYDKANLLYASSTYDKTRPMNPGEILQPFGIDDICNVVNWASSHNPPVPIAIRTGGHQYSGACSTGPTGVQLDLQSTFRNKSTDLVLERDEKAGKVYIKSSVSWMLGELYDFMKANGVFMPTGQCVTVCLGGHVQTGGYGMLARAFGLLGDYIVELDVVTYDGQVRTLIKDGDDADLFYGFLGGSPGNLGVLTHFKVEVQDDNNHVGSKGLWMAFNYSRGTLETLLGILAEKGEDPNFERNYDFTVNTLDASSNLLDHYPGPESELRDLLPKEGFDEDKDSIDLIKFKYPVISVYAQWVKFDGDVFDSSVLFDKITSIKPTLFKFQKPIPDNYPMSQMMTLWLFKAPREFPYPYVKRTNLTYSNTLTQDKWPSWFSGRVHEIVSHLFNGLWMSSQIQVMGGTNSMFRQKANQGTAYTWREATIGGTWDLFYSREKKPADDWQNQTDAEAKEHFSPKELRLLWGSYGPWEMSDPNVWGCYYDVDTYRKLQQIRKTYDPNGVFTASPFCVERAS